MLMLAHFNLGHIYQLLIRGKPWDYRVVCRIATLGWRLTDEVSSSQLVNYLAIYCRHKLVRISDENIINLRGIFVIVMRNEGEESWTCDNLTLRRLPTFSFFFVLTFCGTTIYSRQFLRDETVDKEVGMIHIWMKQQSEGKFRINQQVYVDLSHQIYHKKKICLPCLPRSICLIVIDAYHCD